MCGLQHLKQKAFGEGSEKLSVTEEFKEIVKQGLEHGSKGAIYIIKAGEQLIIEDYPREKICARLKHEFCTAKKDPRDESKTLANPYSPRFVEMVCPDDWKDYTESREPANEDFRSTLTNNLVYRSLQDSDERVNQLATGMANFTAFFTNPNIKLEVRKEAWGITEGYYKNNNTVLIELQNLTKEASPLVEQLRGNTDLRIALPNISKAFVMILACLKSRRHVHQIVRETTKWLSKLTRKLTEIGPIRCPCCYCDIRDRVAEIQANYNKEGEYLQKCEEMDELKERIFTLGPI